MLPTDSSSTTLQLTVECHHLPKLDALSASDTFVVLYELHGEEKKSELGRTETRRDESDPRFAQMFDVPYRFEEVQQLRLDVYDDDNEGAELKKHELIGRALVQLGQVVCARGRSAQLALSTKDGKACVGQDGKSSVIIVKVEEVREATKDILFIEPRCEKLKKIDLFGTSDPYMELHRVNDGGDTQVVYASYVQRSTLDPNWGVVELPVAKVCSGDLSRVLQAYVFDWNKSGRPDLIGQCRLSLRQLLVRNPPIDNAKPLKIELRQPEMSWGDNRGALVIDTVRLQKRSSFVDYLRGGLRLQLSVAIDFSASNGDPRLPSGLHYMGPEGNDYLRVIRSVGAVLQPYDADNMIGVYGFGGCLPDESSDFFPLCREAERLPEQCSACGGHCSGQCCGPLEPGKARRVPGVEGDADFSEMEEELNVEGSEALVNRDGRREIVQFVRFNQFRTHQSRFAAHALKKIPGQVERFMWINEIEPAAP